MPERKAEDKIENWPLWQRELHAWRSNPHRDPHITMPTKVAPEFSLLREHLIPRGFDALRHVASKS